MHVYCTVLVHDSIYAECAICYSLYICPSFCPSITQLDKSKTVKLGLFFLLYIQ